MPKALDPAAPGEFGLLRANGMRPTIARVEVLRALRDADSAAAGLTRMDVVEHVGRDAPGVGMSTIFRALADLTRTELVGCSGRSHSATSMFFMRQPGR
jgi:Fe2+ or Zn2+ uptake regulation protein